MKLDPQDINYLIWRYLVENGFDHTAWSFYYEAAVNSDSDLNRKVPANSLLNLLALGQRYAESKYILSSSAKLPVEEQSEKQEQIFPLQTPIVDIQIDYSRKYAFIRDRSASLLVFRIEDGVFVEPFFTEAADGADNTIAAAVFYPNNHYIHAMTKAGLHFIVDPSQRRVIHRRFLFRKESRTTPAIMKFNTGGLLIVAGNSPFIAVINIASRNSDIIDLRNDVPNLQCITDLSFHPAGPQAIASAITTDNKPTFVLMNLANRKFIEYSNNPIINLGFVHKLVMHAHNVFVCHEHGLDLLPWPEAKMKPGSKNHIQLIDNCCVYDAAATLVGDECLIGFVPSGGDHNGNFLQLSYSTKKDNSLKLDYAEKMAHSDAVECIKIVDGANSLKPTFVTVSQDSTMAVIKGDSMKLETLPAPSVTFCVVGKRIYAGLKSGELVDFDL